MDEVEEILGWAGRMITRSKSTYSDANPDHAVVFNANVCVAGEKRWYGDLDLTLDEPLLRQVAAALEEQVVVLAERDARFSNEESPRLDRALLVLEPDGDSWFDPRHHRRAEDGTLRLGTPSSRAAIAQPLSPPRAATVQDRPPNFRDNEGNLYLIRCFACDPKYGRENQLTSAADGRCVWCGWSESEPARE